MSDSISRRGIIAAGALVNTMAVAGTAAAQAAAPPPAPAPVEFTPQPLPFDPKAVPGLSEKLLTSHHDNNYVGAVKRLGAIRTNLAGLDPATAPVFVINGLKREELLAWNSMILHELYFSGFSDLGVQPSAPLSAAIARDFGSFDRWRADFSALGKALGGGSGWALLMWSHRDRRLTNQWAADHTMTLAGATPILALDMYEHAYHMDYGAKAAAYVDAVIKTVSWKAANAAFARASA